LVCYLDGGDYMKKEILDEIINLKSRKQELEAECGVKDHNMNVFTHDQLNTMETDMQRHNACIALEAINKRIHDDERDFRRM